MLIEFTSNPGVVAWTAASTQKNAGATSGVLVGLGLATWMEVYTYDGVNLVLPDMAGTFGVSQDQASWILTTYISSLLFSVPLSIWMANRVGYLRYIIAATVVFAVASVGCAAAADFRTFLSWRAIQGFAGAGLTMWWRAGVYILMTGPRRSQSIMRLSVTLYLATTVGLVFCGYVTDNFGWRLIFLPNVLFAVAAIRFLVRYFPDVPHPADPRANAADKLGIGLLGIALVSLQIVLSRGEIDDWFNATNIQLLTWTGGVALILFIAWQLNPRNSAPLLRLELRAPGILTERLSRATERDADRPDHVHLCADGRLNPPDGFEGRRSIWAAQSDCFRLRDAGRVDVPVRQADDHRDALYRLRDTPNPIRLLPRPDAFSNLQRYGWKDASVGSA
jgi:MFS family permease